MIADLVDFLLEIKSNDNNEVREKYGCYDGWRMTGFIIQVSICPQVAKDRLMLQFSAGLIAFSWHASFVRYPLLRHFDHSWKKLGMAIGKCIYAYKHAKSIEFWVLDPEYWTLIIESWLFIEYSALNFESWFSSLNIEHDLILWIENYTFWVWVLSIRSL